MTTAGRVVPRVAYVRKGSGPDDRQAKDGTATGAIPPPDDLRLLRGLPQPGAKHRPGAKATGGRVAFDPTMGITCRGLRTRYENDPQRRRARARRDPEPAAKVEKLRAYDSRFYQKKDQADPHPRGGPLDDRRADDPGPIS